MLHDHLEIPTSVDAKTAEEALSLAVRLQQERGNRVSLEELQRTADEAGIDRDCLESALHAVGKKAEEAKAAELAQAAQQAEFSHADQRRRRRWVSMMAGMTVAVFVATVGQHSPQFLINPIFMVVFVTGGIIGGRAMGQRLSGCSKRRFRD